MIEINGTSFTLEEAERAFREAKKAAKKAAKEESEQNKAQTEASYQAYLEACHSTVFILNVLDGHGGVSWFYYDPLGYTLSEERDILEYPIYKISYYGITVNHGSERPVRVIEAVHGPVAVFLADYRHSHGHEELCPDKICRWVAIGIARDTVRFSELPKFLYSKLWKLGKEWVPPRP